MKTKTLIAGLFLASGLVACSQSTQQAPGTMPGDMSQEAHLQEAEKHDEEAVSHEKEGVRQTKGPQRMKHSHQADEESDIAGQHRQAAEQAEPEQ